MPLHVSSTCAHHQEVKFALHSHWYHHPYRCDDTRGLFHASTYFEHMCSKHVDAWNKLIVKQNFCASSWWLIIEINILRCTVSKTSQLKNIAYYCMFKIVSQQFQTLQRRETGSLYLTNLMHTESVDNQSAYEYSKMITISVCSYNCKAMKLQISLPCCARKSCITPGIIFKFGIYPAHRLTSLFFFSLLVTSSQTRY